MRFEVIQQQRMILLSGKANTPEAEYAKVDTKPVDKVAITVKRYGADSLAAQLAAKGVFL